MTAALVSLWEETMTTYTAWGFDFADGSGITAAQLIAQGCNFVCRYLSGTPGSGKDISSSEISNYKAAGINVVFNWETGGQEISEAQGVSDAQAAQSELNELASQSGVSAVASAPIIFSCDAAPDATVDADSVAYMRGVNSVIGLARSGGYGGYGAIQAMFNAGVITYGWQTYAWSGGMWDSRAQLQQYQNNVTVGSTSVDRDRATAADYGQCQWSVSAPPPPAMPTYDVPTGLRAVLPTVVTLTLSWDQPANVDNTGDIQATYHVQFADAWDNILVDQSLLETSIQVQAHAPGTYNFRVAVHQSATHNGSATTPWFPITL
jgi:hypothetical protein